MSKEIRISLLENLTMSILLVPYIAIKEAGEYHVAALLFGLAISAVYIWIIYAYSIKLRRKSIDIASSGYCLIDACYDAGKIKGNILAIVYIIRFLLRSAFVVYVVGRLVTGISTFLPPVWIVVVIFTIVCVYGAAGSFEKRRNLANILLGWMIIPLILLVVFSVVRMNYADVARAISEIKTDSEQVFHGAWFILSTMSTFELTLFTMCRTDKKDRKRVSGHMFFKLVLWVFLAILVAYFYVLGMAGREYVAEASTFRISFGTGIDYALAGAWIVGAFYLVSSYIFYSKEFLLYKKTDILPVDNVGKKTGGKIRIMTYLLLFAVILFFVCCIDYDRISSYVMGYLMYADAAVSLLIPGVVMGANHILSRERVR